MKNLMMIAVIALCVSIAAGNVYAESKALRSGENFTLTGVIYMEGGGGLAYLQEPKLTNNAIVAVKPGAKVGPYKLTKILEDRVELEGPSGTIVVPLYGSAGGTGVAASAKKVENQAAQAVPPATTQGGTPPPNVLEKIYAGNPNVHYYPIGSPNRNIGLGGMFKAMQAGK